MKRKQLTLDTIRSTILARFAQHEILCGMLVGIEVAAYPRGAEDEEEGRVAGYDGDFVTHYCSLFVLLLLRLARTSICNG